MRLFYKTCYTLTAFAMLLAPVSAQAFCGFYVAKADTRLFNKASKVVLVNNDDKTVITMANDFQGDVKDFAIVIPVPTFIEREQIHVTNTALIDHLDAYTSPRLVEYHDPDPCQPVFEGNKAMRSMMPMAAMKGMDVAERAKSLGVKIEAEYTVGEYDIQILSAKQSGGLLTFLNQEGYKLPLGAKRILGSYIKQDMRFFVAKVNLDEFSRSGYTYLRPLQVAYEHDKFMLPIRLGTLNANGAQELFVFTLTKNGRVETSNYRTVKVPTDINIPVFVENDFGSFYKAMFDKQVEREGMKAVHLEYAWDMSWCDPCAADPLSADELQELGVFWLARADRDSMPQERAIIAPRPQPMPRPLPIPMPAQAQNVYVTRLHLRYTADTFPEDLMFNETNDRSNFQGRYVMQKPFTGAANCPAGREYLASLPARFEQEAQNLARITTWSMSDIRRWMEDNGQSFDKPAKPRPDGKWWKNIWKN